jgi:hypothetical protein
VNDLAGRHLERRPVRRVSVVSDSNGSPSRTKSSRFTSRGWSFALAALWLLFTGIAVSLWIGADDSRGRWLAGIQCFLGFSLVTVYLVQARQRRSAKKPLEEDA